MSLEVGSILVAHVDRDRIVLESPDKVIDELQNYFGDVSRKVSLAKELVNERRLEAKKENVGKPRSHSAHAAGSICLFRRGP